MCMAAMNGGRFGPDSSTDESSNILLGSVEDPPTIRNANRNSNRNANEQLDVLDEESGALHLGDEEEDDDNLHENSGEESSENAELPPIPVIQFKEGNDASTSGAVNTTMMNNFDEYVRYAKKNFAPLMKEEEAAIKLLKIMFKKRAPLNSFEDIQQWRKDYSNEVEDTTSGNSPFTSYPLSLLEEDDNAPVTRKALLKKLYKRCNLKVPTYTKVQLPHSKAIVKIPIFDFESQLVSLLTDPRINPLTDYSFTDNDPFAEPPQLNDIQFVDDIKSGRAFIATYHAIIDSDAGEALLGIIFYIDEAVTGQYDHLPVKALKFSLAILKKTILDKEWAWREVGFVTSFVKEDTIGRQMFEQSNHMDVGLLEIDSDEDDSTEDSSISDSNESRGDSNAGEMHVSQDSDDESAGSDNTEDNVQNGDPDDDESAATAVKAQDLHTQLDVILDRSGFKAMQDSGFRWKLNHNNEIKDVLFKIFVPFVKGDTDEHDKHCGSYTSRQQHVQQLCRY